MHIYPVHDFICSDLLTFIYIYIWDEYTSVNLPYVEKFEKLT